MDAEGKAGTGNLRSTFLTRSPIQIGHGDLGIEVGRIAKVDAIVADHRVLFDAVFHSESVVPLYTTWFHLAY
jgi:hypothetical protein